MTAAEILAKARSAGAEFRLDPSGAPQFRYVDDLPAATKAALDAHSLSIAAALEAEMVERSPIPWEWQRAGWSARTAGSELRLRPIGDRWALTATNRGLTAMVVSRDTLRRCLAKAHSASEQPAQLALDVRAAS